MKYLSVASLLSLAVILGACSTSGAISAPSADQVENVATTVSPAPPRETLLLVSLEDGSIIKQTISSSAELCFKKNSDSFTTCLTQGAPVIDPATDTIIGFEMIEDHIELVAKSD